MTDPISLNEARADKSNDPRDWTPLDCLRALVRDLESGECKSADIVYVAMMRRTPDAQAESFPFYTAGATGIELRGVMAQHLHDICEAFGKR